MHSPKSYSANSAGFTLIEVMIAIVIIGLVAALAGPRFASLTSNVTHDQNYNKFRASWGKCRAQALNSPHPMTMPTSMTVYPNGYACIVWNDLDADGKLGSGGAPSSDKLAKGDAGGEVWMVYFQERFDTLEDLDSMLASSRINFTKSKYPNHPTSSTGLFIFSSGGLIQTSARDLNIGGTQGRAVFIMEQDGGQPSSLELMVSGQMDGL